VSTTLILQNTSTFLFSVPRWAPAWIIALGMLLLPVRAEQQVKADRAPLTYRDSGLYCTLSFAGVTNMLTLDRAAGPDSPWNFYIFGMNDPARPEDAKLIERMAANGKKVILRVDVGRLAPNAQVDIMEQRLLEMLRGLDPEWVYAITLGEEQVFWNGWTQALTELYHRAKKHWPTLPVYQWWSPMEVPNVRGTSAWVALPADGWVIDLYGRHREEFEKKLIMTLETGRQVIHIVWSSPDWPEFCGAKSWDEGGRQVFEDQVEICRSYNVPVAHFCTQAAVRNKEGKVVEQIRSGWNAVNPIVRSWYRYIEVMAENSRRLPDTAIGFRTLDKRVFDWAHGIDRPPALRFKLDERERKQVSVRVDLSKIPLKPGEHLVPLGEAGRFFKMTCILDGSASDLKPGMVVVANPGRAVAVSITFRIEPVCPVTDLSVSANAQAPGGMRGSATASASMDGKEWSQTLQSDPKKPNHSLTLRRPGAESVTAFAFSQEPIWIRVQLQANGGPETNPVARLDELVLSAAVAPPLN
jgi:hypothetical protein